MFIALQKLPCLYSIAVYIDPLKKWNLTQSKPKEKKRHWNHFTHFWLKWPFDLRVPFWASRKIDDFFHLWRHRAEFHFVDDVIVAESYF